MRPVSWKVCPSLPYTVPASSIHRRNASDNYWQAENGPYVAPHSVTYDLMEETRKGKKRRRKKTVDSINQLFIPVVSQDFLI